MRPLFLLHAARGQVDQVALAVAVAADSVVVALVAAAAGLGSSFVLEVPSRLVSLKEKQMYF